MFSCVCSSPTREQSVVDAESENESGTGQSEQLNTSKMERQVQMLLESLTEKESHVTVYEQELAEKDNRIFELVKEIDELKARSAKKDDESVKIITDNWTSELEEKNRKIEKLEDELKKRTCDLQAIVNKELWEKNREIEKLQKRYGNMLELKQQEISKLGKELTITNSQLQVLKDSVDLSDMASELTLLKQQLYVVTEERNFLSKKVSEMQNQIANIPNRDIDYTDLKTQLDTLKQEYDDSLKLREESVQLCALLTTRLEELATFLNSLLKNKSVLGFLGAKQRTAIKEALEQSLDLSKNLSVTFSLNPDQSLIQLTSLSSILNVTRDSHANILDCWTDGDGDDKEKFSVLPQGAILTYNNNFKIVKDDKVDNELLVMDKSLNNQSFKNENEQQGDKMERKASLSRFHVAELPSDSEEWSEPDRTVSMARIGLVEDPSRSSTASQTANSRSRSQQPVQSSESTDEANALNRTPSKRCSILAENKQTILLLQETIDVLESKLKENESNMLEYGRLKEVNVNLVKELADTIRQRNEIEARLVETEQKLLNAEEKKAEIERQFGELEKVVFEIAGQKDDVSSDLIMAQSKMEELEKQKELVLGELKQAKKETEDALVDYKVAEMRVKTVEENAKQQEASLREEYEAKMQQLDSDWEEKFEEVERNANVRIQSMHDAINNLKSKYEQDYVSKSEFDKCVEELSSANCEIERLKNVLNATEVALKNLKDHGEHLTNCLKETEKQSREKQVQLKKELDEAALSASQAVLERTRVVNEKLKLEQELRKLESKDSELLKQNKLAELQLEKLTDNVQKLEEQKTALELKVSEMETANAELHNRLARMPPSRNVWTIPPKVSQYLSPSRQPVYARQQSDMSGYASEEILTDGEAHQQVWNSPLQSMDAQSRNVNSSPDLGIESDQGRFSSLEANVNRPLLQTLELTQSMNNLLTASELSVVDVIASSSELYDIKSLQAENENLKKRLQRTRQALEETVHQLTLANKRKKEVEKAVCKQIHKTSIVLRQARFNLDSGSETDIAKK